MPKVRIDKLLVERKLVPSREKGAAMIMAGLVLVDEVKVEKPGQTVRGDAKIRILEELHKFVGRGGIKLEHALKEFGIDVKGKVCMDVGASTGGFTDCLLQMGAAKVFAIDVGYGQLDWRLRNDPRVVVMERTNIKTVSKLTSSQVDKFEPAGLLTCEHVNIVVVDVSFISLVKVFPYLDALIEKGGSVVALIKPQFEAGKGRVGKGGIVRDEAVREECVKNVCSAADILGWNRKGVTVSPITGADGNVEYLAWWIK